VFLKNLGQSSEIRLSLVPESLGDLSVKLTVNSSGTVDAHVVAQTADARDALVAGQTQLTRSLADAGLKLSSFNVDVNSGGFTGYQQQQQQQQQQSAQQRWASGSHQLLGGLDAVESGDETALLAVPSFGPPLVAGQNLGHLNYLA
jgi:flagellar hook-length control protein FliK